MTTDRQLHLHVSPVASEPGALTSLMAARDAIRAFRRETGGIDRPVTVHVADGVYELPETLVFGAEDGGTEAFPVCYVAAPGAAPVVSGGRRIQGWRETEHGGLRCWIVELPEVVAGTWNFTRLYVNGAARQRPRLPKQGFHRFTGLAGWADTGFRWCQGPDRASFAPGDLRPWHNWQDVELISYQLWFDTHHRLKAIDEAAGVVQFHANSLGSLRDERGQFARYFVENVFEALDTPGEWYLDRAAGRLTYLPLPHETLATTAFVAPRLAELVRLQGRPGEPVSHLRFENLCFAHQQWELPLTCPGYIQAASGVPGAVILEGAEQCIFYGCTVAHVNGYGIEVLAGSAENVLAACTVHDAGGGGIKIGHEMLIPRSADDPTVTPVGWQGEPRASATTIADCTIRDCGHIYPSAIGIWVGNSGWNRLLHNRIFNCNYTGISCGWTWGYAPTRTVANRIEYNHIHHINDREILSDNGGIYTLGQQPGTVLRGNRIHDISCYGYGAWGIYPDEGSSEMRIEQNLVCGTKRASYSTHYGRDNLVRQNIFALSQNDHLSLGKWELHRTTLFRRNLVVTANGRVGGNQRLARIAHYTMEDNLFWSLDGTRFTYAGGSLASLQAQGQFRGTLVADPLFADAPGGDFALRPDSPARSLGFEPFDWRAAGPRFVAERPLTYADYADRFPLPSLDVPVVRTGIAAAAGADAGQPGRVAFTVTVSNVGRARATGGLRLAAGPEGDAGMPDLTRLAFDLAPGEQQVATVHVAIHRPAAVVWLESEPDVDCAVPARGLLVAADFSSWKVPVLGAAVALAELGQALASMPARAVHRGDRLVAEVRLGACAEGLLVHGCLHEPSLRPNPDAPWKGTCIELLAYQPRPKGASVHDRTPCHQVCLIPRDTDAIVRHLEPGSEAVLPAPGAQAWARQVDGGCEIAAIVPWALLGHDAAPAELPFQMIVDSLDPATGAIVQTLAFDMPADGWRQLQAKLVIG